jgi:hypothetical protein
MVVASALSLLLRAHLVRENRRRDALALGAAGTQTAALADTKSHEHGDEDGSSDDQSILEDDRTDRTNPAFRYSL